MERARQGRVLRASSPDDPVEVVVLDPFAGADHPLAPPVLPVAVAALAPLFAAAGRPPSRVRAVLAEEDPVKAEWLVEACARVGLGERAGRPAGPVPPEIAVVEGAWEAAEAVWTGIAPAPAELALLDPPAAGRLPLERLVSLLAARPGLDLLLRFPASDLRRLSGFRGVPLADLPPYARRAADGISRLLGDPRQEWALAWRARQAAEGDAAAEAVVVEALAERLRREGEWRVRVFRAGPSTARESFLLATRDPRRALLVSEVLFEARGAGLLPWPEEAPGEGEIVRLVPRGELELFGGAGKAAGEARDRVVDLPALAHALAGRFAGRRVPYGEVLASVLESDLFEGDVRRALAALRREGRALYRSLADPAAEVAFPRSGAERAPGRSRSRRRDADAGDLFLPLDPPDGPPDGPEGAG